MWVTPEKFLPRAKHADILITFRGPESGIKTKEMLRESSRLLQTVDIRSMNGGKIYFTGHGLYQSADTAESSQSLRQFFIRSYFLKKERQNTFMNSPKDKEHATGTKGN